MTKQEKLNINKAIFNNFSNHIKGSYGCFETPSGKVNYLQVTARITTSGVNLEDALAGNLVPVREILDPKKMDFGQLLQRDLDDHRVATKLVPYILDGKKNEPSYFPPIQAVLLPFEVGDETKLPEPQDNFGEFIPNVSDADEIGLNWAGYQYGESYRFLKLSYSDGTPLDLRQGRLSWHNKRARLVVIDGQHRAMAMLAIYRTLHTSWKGTGSHYRHFYEGKIKETFAKKPELAERLKNGIEYPVTITWFEKNHHKSARKLFVDVNKNAKPPTNSRLILLGENKLSDIFTREILNRLRQDDSKMNVPIYAIEYDYSELSTSQTGRWSSLVNIEMLRAAVHKAVWGPTKYIENLCKKVSSGRESLAELDLRFREQLQLDKWLDQEVEDSNGEIFERDDIGHTDFPKSEVHNLEAKFYEGWGKTIIHILGNFLPYKKHVSALHSLNDSWGDSVDNEAALAHEAIFDGVGLYWTLKDSYDHWADRDNKIETIKPDTVAAWGVVRKKEQEFYQERSKLYFGSKDKFHIVQDMYSKTNTYACLLGLTMSVASIAEHNEYKGNEIFELSTRFISTLNSWFENSPIRKTNRKLFLSTRLDISFNQMAKLDQPYWVYFRYFWFEVALCSIKEESSVLTSAEEDFIRNSINDMRDFYYSNVVYIEQKKALKKVSDKTGIEFDKEVEEKALTRYNKILKYWFAEEYQKNNS